MITYVKGNIFESPAKIIVNTVNTVGVMGKGVALEYKNRYPRMYDKYVELCENKQLDIGNLFLWKGTEKWVLLFPTKKHWRNPSQLEYIEKGLKKLADNWDKLGTDSIAFPRLGCGNGGLDWNIVKPLMEKYLSHIPLEIIIYVDKYEDPIPEYLDITEIEKWLAGELELTGYEAFRKRLGDYVKNPISILGTSNKKYEIYERDGVLYINQEECDDMTVCDMWNWIRDVGIVRPEELPYEFRNFSEAILEIMKNLKYVSKVIVSNNGIDFPSKPNAYQYISV